MQVRSASVISILALATMAAIASAPVAPAASSGAAVVAVTVLSSTLLTDTGCLPATTDITDFGAITVNSSHVTSDDCVVVFGSSNDTASLRLAQRDGAGTAMGSAEFADQPTGVGNHLKGAALVNATTGWFAGYNGRILYTVNAGATWTTQPTGTAMRFLDMVAPTATHAWAVGEAGTIFATSNSGGAWGAQTSGVAVDLNGAAAASTTHAWAVGNGGTIIRTTDGGATPWTTLVSGTGQTLRGIDSASTTSAWAIGDAGLLLRTTNGTSWSVEFTASENLYDIDIVTPSVGWVVGRDGYVARTLNGGTSWTQVTAPTVENLSDIVALDASSAWVVGDLGSIYRTYDGGATWDDLSVGTISYDSIMAMPGRVWVGGQSGTILVSPLDSVPDYIDGVTDWNQGAAAFGACLREVTDATPTWNVNAACTKSDGNWWRAVPATTADPSAEVARTATGQVGGVANLRWGFRTALDQRAGAYDASVRFEVVAPG
ncbi:MAG: hypothetical protein JWM90_2939 [Thermoleophilia bacterium]|nr:hypothetical protein [Thermoleophilia bacterium]